MTLDGGLTMGRMIELGRVSRSGFYRLRDTEETGKRSRATDMDLRDGIQRIALKWPAYGRPRITIELRQQGWTVIPSGSIA
jgi:putative transposase